ncbi:acetyltransferase [Burkholderia pseudomallei]|uniref:GNAT family N-acetyltransferase n=1 Tax=Burkholderia pseudomallei TaxID=28450 RepID=UPI00018A4F1D|nr:N-acetyltransferase [Burkholderia pseudomallei]AIO95681.1 acetyltransferase family protein [Burkholderia pseudomallei 576]EEC35306.1 acetyltransferase, GNAT family [Burkholderia pseudomallei 576]KGD28694.1 acetyltransferase family protein [Burkholderia pseudomallei]KGV72575.1 acetyltransferase family protein [Burkholderia pseudomallei MSHR3964]KGV85337.1 acetyltransferase family protein [Burkholderia pseudomallei MSHR3951]
MTAAATAPGGAVTLRGERAGDAAALARVIVAAFADEPQGGQFERRIVDALRADGRLSVSLVAVRDGRLVGHVAFSPVAIGAGGEGWHGLAPLAVWPGCQRQGIGAALVRAGLNALRRAGARGCVVLGEPAYYARFGFGPAGDIVFPQAPPDALMALPFGEHAPCPAGELRYHASFYA